MKSLKELEAIRDKARAGTILRQENPNRTKILVGMGTCGIASGAKDVLNAFLEEVENGLKNVVVIQTGCVGNCNLEPIVEIVEPGKEKVKYVKMNPDKVKKVVKDHILGSNVVTEYTENTNS